MQHLRQASSGRSHTEPLRLRRPLVGPVRPGSRPRGVAARHGGLLLIRHVALCARPSRRDERHVVSMGEGWTPLIRTRRLGKRSARQSVGQRRRAQPDRHIQSARTLLRDIHVPRTRHKEGRDPLGRKCRRSARGICRCGRNRGSYLHAARRASRQLHRVQGVWRARHSGGRADFSDCGRIVAPAARPKAGSTSLR